MVTYAYSRNIPDGPNNPSADQPNMKINTNSTEDLIGEDHNTFRVANGGMHKWARLVNVSGAFPSPIPGMITTAGALYTRTIRSANQLMFRDGTNNIEYQLTSISNSSVASFANNTAYDPPRTYVGGWTFLPGRWLGSTSVDNAMLMQYGLITSATGLVNNSTGTINFPRGYNTAAFSVTITPIVSPTSNEDVYIISVSASSFTYRNTSTGGITGFYWMAIGV